MAETLSETPESRPDRRRHPGLADPRPAHEGGRRPRPGLRLRADRPQQINALRQPSLPDLWRAPTSRSMRRSQHHPSLQADHHPLLDELSDEARAFGAVNTVVKGGRRSATTPTGGAFAESFRRACRMPISASAVQTRRRRGRRGRRLCHPVARLQSLPSFDQDHATARDVGRMLCPRYFRRPTITASADLAAPWRSAHRPDPRHAHRHGEYPGPPLPPELLSTPALGRRDRLFSAGDRASEDRHAARLRHARRRRHGGLPGRRRLQAFYRPASPMPPAWTHISRPWPPESRPADSTQARDLAMKTSIATVSISGDLAREARRRSPRPASTASRSSRTTSWPSTASPREVGRMVRDHGLEITLFQPFRDFEGMPEPQRARAFDRAERKFDVMQELGTDLMLVCSNVSPAVARRHRPGRGRFPRTRRARGKARPARRLRGAGLGPARQRPSRRLGDRAPRRPSAISA